MSKQIYFRFLVELNADDGKRIINYLVGQEEHVANFLVAMTNGDLYRSCLGDLYQQAQEDAKLMESFNIIVDMVKVKLEDSMDRPIMKPSQTFGKKDLI